MDLNSPFNRRLIRKITSNRLDGEVTIPVPSEEPPPKKSEDGGADYVKLVVTLLEAFKPKGSAGGFPDTRVTGLYGEIDEEKISQVVYNLLVLKDTGTFEQPVDPENLEKGTEIVSEPVDIIISSHGGVVVEMFALYDLMVYLREDMELRTIGLGKVESGASLIFAAGTHGKRFIGRNCRLMVHGVTGGPIGKVAEVAENFKEMKTLQELFVKALEKETKLTKREIKKIVDSPTDTIYSATKAVKYGFADYIL